MRVLTALAVMLFVCGCTQQGKVCQTPYIPHNGACCLDADGNGECDPANPAEIPTTTSLPGETTTTTPEAIAIETSTSQTTLPPETTTTQATPTQTKPACTVNADCGPPRVLKPYCDGNTVRSGVETPSCKSPGTPQAVCEFRRTTQVNTTCDAYCFRGACYHIECYNGIKDYDEEGLDCGLACPPCNLVNVKHCKTDTDCGIDEYAPIFMCYNGAVTRNVTRYACVNLTCTNLSERSVVERCKGNSTCWDGREKCVPAEGSCSDCVMNQNEEGVDCGGFCSRCAPHPDNYTSPHTDINMSGFNYSASLGDWGFKYAEPIMQGNCVTGAKFIVKRPDNYPTEVRLTRSRNSQLDGRVMGFYTADDNTANIWVLDKTG